MSSFSEKTGDHLLGSASFASNFCWIWLILKHPYPLKSTIHHLSQCHRHVSKRCDRIFEPFFQPIDTSLFLSDWQIVCDPTHWMYLTIGHTTILQYQLAHSINSFRNNNWFYTTFTKFVLEWTTTSAKFTIPSVNAGPWWSFIAKILTKFIDAWQKTFIKVNRNAGGQC